MIKQYTGEWRDTNYDGLINNLIPKTALLGNGDVGVISGGDADVKTFIISKSDFRVYGGSPVPIGGVTIKNAVYTMAITDFYEKQDIFNAEIRTEFKWDGNPAEMTSTSLPEIIF